MVARKKIDSNETGLSFAEEIDLGVLPGTNGADAVWYPFEPNSYDDFGGELTLLARNPINASRQRKKGSVTDLDASGGFNQDFTQTNTQRILQGFMFADFREKLNSAVDAVTATGFTVADEAGFAAGQIVATSGFAIVGNNGRKIVTGTTAGEVTVAGLTAEATPPAGAKIGVVGFASAAGDFDVVMFGGVPTIVSTAFDFTTLGLIPGEWIYIGGDTALAKFATAGNNGFTRVKSVAAHALVIDQSLTSMSAEANTTQTVELYVPARVLKNELEELVKRRSYQIERRLGAPDTAQPTQRQAEYLKGQVPSEFVMNIGQADKINVDMSFIGTDNEQRLSTEGVKPGTRVVVAESDMFNTSTDIVAFRVSVIDPANPSPNPLFGYLTELTITLNNNLSANKAVAVLGAFDITAGTFEVSAEATAYFADVAATRAIRQNANVQLLMALYKANAGVVVDMPLVGLGNGRLNVEQNEPITLPLTIDAASASLINPETDYTLMWSFFDYLPTVAGNKG